MRITGGSVVRLIGIDVGVRLFSQHMIRTLLMITKDHTAIEQGRWLALNRSEKSQSLMLGLRISYCQYLELKMIPTRLRYWLQFFFVM